MKIYLSYLKDVKFDKINGWSSNLNKIILFWNIVPCNSNLNILSIQVSDDNQFNHFDSFLIDIDEWYNREGLSFAYEIDYSNWINSTKYFRILANNTYSNILRIQFKNPIDFTTLQDLLNILPGNHCYNKELNSNISLFYSAYVNEFNDVKKELNLIKNEFLYKFWDLTRLNLTNLNSYDILFLNHYLYSNRNKLGSVNALKELGHFLTGMDASYKFKKDEPYIIIGDNSNIYYRLNQGIVGTNPQLNPPLEGTNSLRRSIYVIFKDPKNILSDLDKIKNTLIELLQEVVGCAFYFQFAINEITYPNQRYTIYITINPPDGGTVTITPSKFDYAYGEQIQLDATPSPGYVRLSSWGGDISGTENPKIITVTGNLNIIANFTDLPPIIEYNLWKDINNCTRNLIGLSFKTNDLFYQYIDSNGGNTNLVKYNLDTNEHQVLITHRNDFMETYNFGNANNFTEDDNNYYFSKRNKYSNVIYIYNKQSNSVITFTTSTYIQIDDTDLFVFPTSTSDNLDYTFYSIFQSVYLPIKAYKKSTNEFPTYPIGSGGQFSSFNDQFNNIGIINHFPSELHTWGKVFYVDLNTFQYPTPWYSPFYIISYVNDLLLNLAFGKLFVVGDTSYNPPKLNLYVFDFNTKQLITTLDISGYIPFHTRKVISDTDTVGSKYLLFGDTTKPRVMFVNMQTLEVIYKDFSNKIPYQNYSFDRISYSYVKNKLVIFLDKTNSADSEDIKCWFIPNMNIE
jgi:hypothetical protein